MNLRIELLLIQILEIMKNNNCQTIYHIYNDNTFTIEDLLNEFAFDIRLPNKVIDAVTGKDTWASSVNSNKYISQDNMKKYDEYKGWMRSKKDIKSLDDIFKYWDTINYIHHIFSYYLG